METINRNDTQQYLQQLTGIFWQFKRNSPPPATTKPTTAPASASPVDGFVTRDEWRFMLHGQPFFAAGTNLYSIACQQELWGEDTIINTLNFHAQRGVTVLRIWCATPHFLTPNFESQVQGFCRWLWRA